MGVRQSGAQDFRFARLPDHAPLLELARDHARLTIARNPALAGREGEAARQLLYLFERDEAARLLLSG